MRHGCQEQGTDSISLGRCRSRFRCFFSLLFVNTFLMLFLEFAGKHLFSRNALGTFRWYQDNSITIQFILLAFMAVVVFIFRKRIRWDGQK